MTWLRRYRLRHLLRFSFWPVPLGAILAALPAARAARWLSDQTSWSVFDFSEAGARGFLDSMAASMLTFIVFAVSALLLAVQLTSGQLTPRIIALVFSLRRVKISVGVFVFAYTFTLGVLSRIEEQHVPQLSVSLAIFGTLVSIVVFFSFVQQIGMSLRPVAILNLLWERGRKVVDSVYPRAFAPPAAASSLPELQGLPPSSRLIEYAGNSGTFLAFGTQELVAAAQQAGCVIELLPRVGDFVSHGDLLFRLYPADCSLTEDALHHLVAFGSERTLEQDPAFAFRIMVDIAARALSPAINDPTTAVLALDQLHRLLRYVGQKQLNPGRVCDGHGTLRLLYPTPRWEDFVMLAVSEIRLFGAGSLQIPRRLWAMLEHLIAVLPEARTPALREELALLQSAVERAYVEPEDRRRAATADRQGIGGSSRSRPYSEFHSDEIRNRR